MSFQERKPDMDARVKSYLAQIESGKMKDNTVKVLNYIRNNEGCTIEHIKTDLGMQHQTATSRVSVLLDYGVIYVNGQKKIDGTEYSQYCYQADERQREGNRMSRKQDKFKRWVEAGIYQLGEVMPMDLMAHLLRLQPEPKADKSEMKP